MSQVTESTYFYSQNNRDLYQQVLDQFNDKNCVFSRNLLAFLESPQREPGPFYSRHVNECPHCQKKVREFSQTLKTIHALIPDEAPPEDFRRTVSPEIKEAISFWKKKQRALRRERNLYGPEFIKRAASDFVMQGLWSRSFLKGIGLAAMSALILSIVL